MLKSAPAATGYVGIESMSTSVCQRSSRIRSAVRHGCANWAARVDARAAQQKSVPHALTAGRVGVRESGKCDPNVLFLTSVSWPGGWHARKHSVDADVLVNVGPMNSKAIANNLEVVSLSCCGVGESPRPGQWHADRAAIDEMGRDQLVCHFY